MKMKMKLALFVVIHLATVAGVYVPDKVSDFSVNFVIPCPAGCLCSSESLKTAQCHFNYSTYQVTVLSPWQVTRLKIHGGNLAWKVEGTPSSLKNVLYHESTLPASEELSIFSALTHLDISYIPIPLISSEDFAGIGSLEFLTLSYDNISQIEPNTFIKLTKLQILNLDGNQISSFSENVFNGLENLKELRLRSNKLTVLSSLPFGALRNLKFLDLENNLLTEVESFLDSFESLDELNIKGNEIKYISETSVSKLLTFKTVSISRNPFWCSCMLEKLITAYKADLEIFDDDVQCSAPRSLMHAKFIDIDEKLLPCSGANVSVLTPDLNVTYQSELVLECEVFGDEPLAMYWLTPWGQKYSTKQSTDALGKTENLKSDQTFHASNLLLTSKVYVSDNGALHIDKYRGYFAGTYTCVSENAVGESNSTVSVGITSNIPHIYISSLYIGAYCSSAMLGIAVIIGSIRTFVSKFLHAEKCNCCCCRCDDVEIFDEKIKPEDLAVEVEVRCNTGTIDSNLEDPDLDPDLYVPNTPVNSPETNHSAEICSTPANEDDYSEQAKSQAIWDQLDEVRTRLRCGAERKMEKVRSHVRSITDTGSLKIRNIKDAGSIKIQSIKESGSHAASMVKKNVASGMVQVKYGVQSIKEFCGTGDMGPGTISMVSVSTDVDTKECKKIVKSHTFV